MFPYLFREEKTKEQGEGEKSGVDTIKTFAESPVSSGPLHLGDTAHLSIDGMGLEILSEDGSLKSWCLVD